jgi:tetratricopeptide (TPR) repeat protein
MYIKKYILLISILILNLNSCIAQNKGYNITTKSKRAEKFYIKALNLTNKRCYIDAETHLKKAIKIDNKFIEAYLLLGDIFHYLKQDEEAIDAYKETINISPDFFPLKYFIIANIELSVGKYEDAKKHYRAYLNYPEISIENQKKCEDNLKNCEFAINAVKNPVPFKPVNIGDSINTKNREYSPTLTADEQTFIFTVSRAKDKYTNFQGSKEEEA